MAQSPTLKQVLEFALSQDNTGISSVGVSKIMRAYDARLAQGAEEKELFESMLDAYASNSLPEKNFELYMAHAQSINYQLPQTKVGQTLSDALTHAPKLNIQSPAKRIAAIQNRFAARLQGLQAEYIGRLGRKDIVSDEDKETILRHYGAAQEAQCNEYVAFGSNQASWRAAKWLNVTVTGLDDFE